MISITYRFKGKRQQTVTCQAVGFTERTGAMGQSIVVANFLPVPSDGVVSIPASCIVLIEEETRKEEVNDT